MPNQEKSEKSAIVITDLQGKVRQRSGAVQELIDCLAAEDSSLDDLPQWFSGASRVDAQDMLKRCLDRGWAPEQELVCGHRDGHEFPVWVECSLVTDGEGRPVNVTWLVRDAAERSQLQAALVESKEKYRHLFESSPEGITILSLEGVFLDCNESACTISGLTREELIGHSCLELQVLTEENRTKLAQVIATLPQSKGALRFEFQFVRGGAEPRWIENFASLLVSEQGPYAIQILTRDITEQKRTEEELRSSEARFRELADLLPLTVFEMDPDGKLTYVNSTALEQFGYNEADFEAGLNALQMFIPEDRERMDSNIRNRMVGKPPTGREYTALRKDGSTFPASTYTSIIRRENQVVGLRGLVLDMTEIKRSEAQLRQSEERFRMIADSMPLSVIITQMEDGKILYANEHFKSEYGFSDNDMGRLKTTDYFAAPKDRSHMLDMLDRDGQIKDFEIDVVRRDGVPITISVAITPFQYGGYQALLSTIENITERRHAEAALRESERRFRNIAESMPLAVLITRAADGVILYANPKFQKQFEFAIRGREHQSIKEFYAEPDGREKMLAELEKRKILQGHELKMYSQDSSEMLLRGTIQPMSFQGEEALLSVLEDVTERHKAILALHESERRYRELQENIPIGIFQISLDGAVTFVNGEMVRLFGYDSTDEVLAKSAPEVYADVAAREQLLAALNKDGEVKNFEMLLKRRNGSTFWGEMDVTANKDQSGQITHFDGTLTDITDRKDAEAALATSEQRYRLLVESIRIVIARVSYDGEFLFVNRSAALRLGADADQVVGSTMWDVFPQPLAERQIASVREAIDTQKTLTRETQVLVGEKWHWYSTTIQPYPEVNSGVKSALIMADDITKRRRAEEELRVAHEGLKAEQQALVVKNIALKELLGQIDDEKQRIKQQIQANLDSVALPLLASLRDRIPSGLQSTARILEECLRDIGSPYIGELESRFSSLTPREVEICNLIRNGLHSKEIARELNRSVRTVEKFRQQIRRKLGISNKETNLVSFLRNL